MAARFQDKTYRFLMKLLGQPESRTYILLMIAAF